MAKSKRVKLIGPVQWARVFEENRDMDGFEGAAQEWGGTYSLDMFLDAENEAKLKAAGSAKKVKDPKESDIEDVEGRKYTFSRKHEGPFLEASGAPKVLKASGVAWDFDEDGTIGNGSICEITLTIYSTKNPKTGKPGINGTRLDKIKVLNHVIYESEEDQDEEDEIPF